MDLRSYTAAIHAKSLQSSGLEANLQSCLISHVVLCLPCVSLPHSTTYLAQLMQQIRCSHDRIYLDWFGSAVRRRAHTQGSCSQQRQNQDQTGAGTQAHAHDISAFLLQKRCDAINLHSWCSTWATSGQCYKPRIRAMNLLHNTSSQQYVLAGCTYIKETAMSVGITTLYAHRPLAMCTVSTSSSLCEIHDVQHISLCRQDIITLATMTTPCTLIIPLVQVYSVDLAHT